MSNIHKIHKVKDLITALQTCPNQEGQVFLDYNWSLEEARIYDGCVFLYSDGFVEECQQADNKNIYNGD